MFRNYVTIALRNLLRHKGYALTNVGGLAVGLAGCLLLFLYVRHELTYDAFHANADRIVRVTMEYVNGGEANRAAVTGNKVGPAFRRAFPEVEAAVRFRDAVRVVRVGERTFEEKRFLYADSAALGVFSFATLAGDPRTALAAPFQVVLTQSTARRYFGADNPLGRTIQLNRRDGTQDYTVTGVVADVPANSQIKFDLLGSRSSFGAAEAETWWNANEKTYLLLRPNASRAALQAKIRPFMNQQKDVGAEGSNYLTYHLELLRDVHLRSTVEGGFEPNGDIRYVYVFTVIALLILAIACVNYVNLTTARATARAKEVGVRKVLGAPRGQLFWQFMGESAVLVGLSLTLSFVLVWVCLPAFGHLTARALTLAPLASPLAWLGLVGFGLLVSLLAGSYPALVLAGFQPVRVLKGGVTTSAGGTRLRQSLIVVQFVISAFLLVCTLVVQQQLGFIQQKKLGYRKEHVLVLPIDGKILPNLSTFRSEFGQDARVLGLTTAYETPTTIGGGYSLTPPGATQSRSVTALPVGLDFVRTMGMELAAGTDFSPADVPAADSAGPGKRTATYLLNEAAVKDLGWTPQQALGKTITLNEPGEVRGVIKDFHFASLHEPIRPLVIFLQPDGVSVMLVKVTPDNLPATLGFLGNKWKALAPHRPFAYQFLDEEFARLYAAETRTGQTFAAFAGVAIALACLGLLGLVAYTTAQRTKEIGIRKVLGASVPQIVALLSKDFVKLVGLACLLAFPLAGWAMRRWLQDFAYRVDIAWWVFALAGGAALLIALLTVSYQAIRAATANPVKSLRTE